MPKFMENLEITQNETSLDFKKAPTKKGMGTVYPGLELIENRPYQAGTSIKYWM